MNGSGDGNHRVQHNHGSGTFIGRDNFGVIRNEQLDARTKAALAKLSRDAPELAGLLTRALRDGVISPDIVAALEMAVRHINEDVADALMLAGRNINEDVADALMLAGRNINEDVANSLLDAGQSINEDADRLQQVARTLSEVTR